jgi:hypothetical protein
LGKQQTKENRNFIRKFYLQQCFFGGTPIDIILTNQLQL